MSLSNKEIYNTRYSDKNLKLDPKNEYEKNLIDLRFSLLRKYGTGKDILDLCCGTGSYLIPLLDKVKSAVGVDFSSNMLSIFKEKLEGPLPPHLSLHENDATELSVKDNSVDFVFSYTSLYHVEKLDKAFQEVARVLRPGGHAVLEVGNNWSLNKIVVDVQHKKLGWAKIFGSPLCKIKSDVKKAGLKILKVRSLQLLPMYGCPRSLFYLYPLLSPVWKKPLGITLGGKMLDEWFSSLWPLRHFAFRHFLELKNEK